MGMPQSDPLSKLSLPPGFRFYPTDEELLVQYLCRKVAGFHFSLEIIGEVDLYKHDPWVLPSMATFGEKEWYFFSPRDRKYPNGSRPNRVAGSGYWKATGTDKLITTEGRRVGIKKALVFYVGKAPKGTKTNWIMHEYRVIEPSRQKGSPKLDEWVLCRIYKKNSSAHKTVSSGVASMEQYSNGGNSPTSSSSHEVIDSLPEMGNHRSFELPATTSFDATSLHRGDQQRPLNYLQSLGSDSLDWASLAMLSSYPDLAQTQTQSQTQPQQSQGMVNWNNCYSSSTADAPLGSELGCRGEGEGLSGLRTSQSLQNLMDGLSQNSSGLSPFGFPYPNFPGGFGFRQ